MKPPPYVHHLHDLVPSLQVVALTTFPCDLAYYV